MPHNNSRGRASSRYHPMAGGRPLAGKGFGPRRSPAGPPHRGGSPPPHSPPPSYAGWGRAPPLGEEAPLRSAPAHRLPHHWPTPEEARASAAESQAAARHGRAGPPPAGRGGEDRRPLTAIRPHLPPTADVTHPPRGLESSGIPGDVLDREGGRHEAAVAPQPRLHPGVPGAQAPGRAGLAVVRGGQEDRRTGREDVSARQWTPGGKGGAGKDNLGGVRLGKGKGGGGKGRDRSRPGSPHRPTAGGTPGRPRQPLGRARDAQDGQDRALAPALHLAPSEPQWAAPLLPHLPPPPEGDGSLGDVFRRAQREVEEATARLRAIQEARQRGLDTARDAVVAEEARLARARLEAQDAVASREAALARRRQELQDLQCWGPPPSGPPPGLQRPDAQIWHPGARAPFARPPDGPPPAHAAGPQQPPRSPDLLPNSPGGHPTAQMGLRPDEAPGALPAPPPPPPAPTPGPAREPLLPFETDTQLFVRWLDSHAWAVGGPVPSVDAATLRAWAALHPPRAEPLHSAPPHAGPGGAPASRADTGAPHYADPEREGVPTSGSWAWTPGEPVSDDMAFPCAGCGQQPAGSMASGARHCPGCQAVLCCNCACPSCSRGSSGASRPSHPPADAPRAPGDRPPLRAPARAPEPGGGPGAAEAAGREQRPEGEGLACQALQGPVREVSEALAWAQVMSERQGRAPLGEGPRGGPTGETPAGGWDWSPGEDPWQGLRFPCSVCNQTELPGTRCCRGCGAAVCPGCTCSVPQCPVSRLARERLAGGLAPRHACVECDASPPASARRAPARFCFRCRGALCTKCSCRAVTCV